MNVKKRIIPSLTPACVAGAVFALLHAAGAQEAKKAGHAQKLSAEEMKLADANTAVPLPGEILNVLSQGSGAHWKKTATALQSAPARKLESDEARSARLGVCVADAFLALQAENKELLAVRSTEILELARKLGAAATLLESGKKIADLAAAGKWGEVSPLLDMLHGETLKAMKDLGDENSVAVALVAGWLRGTELFADALIADYSENASKALRQGALVDYLQSRLNAVSAAGKGKPEVKAMLDALGKLKPLVTVAQTAVVSKETATQIAAAAKAGLLGQ